MAKAMPSLPAWLVWSLLVLAFLARADHRYFYRSFYLDTQVQLIAAANEQAGHGFASLIPQPSNLAHWQERSERIFQPGYGRLVGKLHSWAGQDWIRASWGVDLLALALCLLSLHGLAVRLGVSRHPWYGFWLLLLGLSPAPLHVLPQTDLLSLGFFLLAGWALTAPDRPLVMTLLAGLALGAAVYFRGAYLGFIPLLPAIWVLRAWFGQRRSLWGVALLAGGLALAIGLAYRAWQLPSGSYLAPAAPGWYPEHLLHVDAFPFKAFFYFGLPHLLALKQLWSPAAGLLQGVAALGSVAITGGLLVAIGPALRQPGARLQPWGLFAQFLGFTWLLNLGMLAWLSLRWAPETWNWTGFWTYLMETRYFAPAQTTLLVATAFLAIRGTQPWLRQGARILLMAALLSGGGYSLWLKYRVHVAGDLRGTFPVSAEMTWLDLVAAAKSQHPAPLVVSHPLDLRIGDLAGAATLPFDSLLVLPQLRASAAVGLMVVQPAAGEAPAGWDRFWTQHGQAARMHATWEGQAVWYWEIEPAP